MVGTEFTFVFYESGDKEMIDRTHEECVECVFQISQPAICKDHAAGPTTCSDFKGVNMRLKDGIFVGKDADGSMYAYENIPSKGAGTWRSKHWYNIHEDIFESFPDLGEWENSLHKVVGGELIRVIDRPELEIDHKI